MATRWALTTLNSQTLEPTGWTWQQRYHLHLWPTPSSEGHWVTSWSLMQDGSSIVSGIVTQYCKISLSPFLLWLTIFRLTWSPLIYFITAGFAVITSYSITVMTFHLITLYLSPLLHRPPTPKPGHSGLLLLTTTTDTSCISRWSCWKSMHLVLNCCFWCVCHLLRLLISIQHFLEYLQDRCTAFGSVSYQLWWNHGHQMSLDNWTPRHWNPLVEHGSKEIISIYDQHPLLKDIEIGNLCSLVQDGSSMFNGTVTQYCKTSLSVSFSTPTSFWLALSPWEY